MKSTVQAPDREPAQSRPLDRSLVGAALGAVLALSVAACLRKVWAADFWWQHAAGQYLAEHGWPTLDVFSYTAADRPWMEMRWLFCLAQYHIENTLGVGALIILKWAAVVTAFGLVSLPVLRRDTRLTLAVVWTVALLAASQRFFVRPELVSYVFIGVFVWVLTKSGQTPKRGQTPPVATPRRFQLLFLLPVLQVVWVNAHPLFIFGPLLVGLGLTVELLRLFRAGTDASIRDDALRRVKLLGGVLAATTLACLLNPYGIQGALHPLLLFSEMRDSVFSGAISELRGPFTFGATYTAVIWYKVLIGLCVVSAVLNLRRLDPFWTLFCITQFYLSTLSIRNLPFFCLAAIPFVVFNLQRSSWLEQLPKQRWFATARRVAAVAVIAVCALYSWRMVTDRISVRQNDSNQFGLGVAAHRFPVDAVDYIQQNLGDGRVYATLMESAYLLSRDIPVYADPRLEVYGEEIFTRYLEAQSGAAGWQRAVDAYDIRTALVDPRSGLAAYLNGAADWKLVYFDSVAAVFAHVATPVPAIQNAADFAATLTRIRERLPSPQPYAEVGLLQRVVLPKPYLTVADFLMSAGRPAEAVEWLEDAAAAGPFLPGLPARRARLAELTGDWSGVTQNATLALEEAPQDPWMMVRLGEAYFRLGEHAPAETWLTRSLRGLPDRALTWSTLGRIHLARQNPGEAERAFRRAVELSPNEAIYHSSLARVQAATGRGAEAIQGLERALALEPNNVTVLRDLVQLHAQQGDLAQARTLLQRALLIAPTNQDLLRLNQALSR